MLANEPLKWNVQEVLFASEGHAVVLAETAPSKTVLKLLRRDGSSARMHIRAI